MYALIEFMPSLCMHMIGSWILHSSQTGGYFFELSQRQLNRIIESIFSLVCIQFCQLHLNFSFWIPEDTYRMCSNSLYFPLLTFPLPSLVDNRMDWIGIQIQHLSVSIVLALRWVHTQMLSCRTTHVWSQHIYLYSYFCELSIVISFELFPLKMSCKLDLREYIVYIAPMILGTIITRNSRKIKRKSAE